MYWYTLYKSERYRYAILMVFDREQTHEYCPWSPDGLRRESEISRGFEHRELANS